MNAAPPPISFAPPDIDDTDVEAVTRVLRSGWLSTGEECVQLEAELAAYLDVPHVIAVSSCTAALEIALDFQHFAPGSRVGVPTWTFAASANAIVHAGATPVLLDIDPDTLNVDVASTAAAIESGLDALMVVHFGGLAVDRAVFDLAAGAGVPVLEDAAHAIGTTDDRGLVSGRGSLGACFSFYATKNLTSGEGGAIATHDDDLAEFARRQRLHGLSRNAWDRYRVGADAQYDLLEPGRKANLPDLLAALARTQLARFATMQARRRHIVTRYRDALAGVEGLRFVPDRPAAESADHLCVVILPEGVDRGEVMAAMTAEGIGTSVHFRPLHTFTWYAEQQLVGPGGVAVADALAPRALSLPLHVGLSETDVDRVVDALARALR